MKHLNFIILKILEKHESSGYDLMKTCEAEFGWKPSAGSMYPVLDQLKRKNLIDFKSEGRKKTYFLTINGKREASKIKKMKEKLLTDMQKRMKIFDKIHGLDNKEAIKFMEKMKKEDKFPFGSLTKDLMDLQKVLFKLLEQNKIEKNKDKIKKIIDNTKKELKKLK